MTADQIREPSDTNRLLAFPYNKWHNSRWGVDQAAAILVTSTSEATLAGLSMIGSSFRLLPQSPLGLCRSADELTCTVAGDAVLGRRGSGAR